MFLLRENTSNNTAPLLSRSVFTSSTLLEDLSDLNFPRINKLWATSFNSIRSRCFSASCSQFPIWPYQTLDKPEHRESGWEFETSGKAAPVLKRSPLSRHHDEITRTRHLVTRSCHLVTKSCRHGDISWTCLPGDITFLPLQPYKMYRQQHIQTGPAFCYQPELYR